MKRPRQPQRSLSPKAPHNTARARAGGTFAAALAVLSVSLGACGDGDPEPNDLECPDGSTLGYANFGRQFVSDYCVSCHAGALPAAARQGAPLDQVFDTLPQIRAKADTLQRQVTIEKRMPFGPTSRKPSDADRLAFGQWLACGAPD